MFVTICLIIPFTNSGVTVIKNEQLPACWAVRVKSKMSQYLITSLKLCDLVCMEVNLERYKMGKKGLKWVTWQAQYSLQTIYLLAKSSYVIPKEDFTSSSEIYI